MYVPFLLDSPTIGDIDLTGLRAAMRFADVSGQMLTLFCGILAWAPKAHMNIPARVFLDIVIPYIVYATWAEWIEPPPSPA